MKQALKKKRQPSFTFTGFIMETENYRINSLNSTEIRFTNNTFTAKLQGFKKACELFFSLDESHATEETPAAS